MSHTGEQAWTERTEGSSEGGGVTQAFPICRLGSEMERVLVCVWGGQGELAGDDKGQSRGNGAEGKTAKQPHPPIHLENVC